MVSRPQLRSVRHRTRSDERLGNFDAMTSSVLPQVSARAHDVYHTALAAPSRNDILILALTTRKRELFCNNSINRATQAG
jgi:hypothetical protein